MWRSFSFRLTVTYVGLFLVSVVLLIGLVSLIGIYQPEQKIQARVLRESRLLQQSYAADGQAALIAALENRARTRSDRLAFHVFTDGDGQVLTGNVPSYPRTRGAEWIKIEADRYADGSEFDHFALARDIKFANGARLIVGRDIEDVEELRENLTRSLIWVLAGSLLLGSAVALIMTRAIGQRLDRIGSTARRVMEGDLSQRIPVGDTDDEFNRVSATLNEMLARIEASVSAISRISDHVAHELRTPLARLMMDVQRLQSGEADERDEIIDRVADETARLRRIFDSVLRIARLDIGRHQLETTTVDIGALATEIAEFYQPAAEAVNGSIRAEIRQHVVADVDRGLIAQALANVIDNAIKYGGHATRINVMVDHDSTEKIISVTNSGSYFTADEADRITERFYRGANSVNRSGEGLGLSLAYSVLAAHGGRICFGGNDREAEVKLILPV